MKTDPQPPARDESLSVADLAGKPDLSPHGIIARRLAVYRARLDQVHARSGAYLDVGFSPYVQDLLERLDAGEHVARGVH